MKHFHPFASAALLMALTSLPAYADQLAFDTLTHSVPYNSGNWFGYIPESNVNNVMAYRFVSEATGHITKLEANIKMNGLTDPITLSLYADNSGEVGSFLEALPVGFKHGGEIFDYAVLAQGNFESGPTLNAGQAYWIVTPLTSTMGTWNGTSAWQPPQGKLYLSPGEGPMGSLAFSEKYDLDEKDARGLRISVSSVPEWPTLPLMMTGLLAMAGGATLRRRSAAMSDTPNS